MSWFSKISAKIVNPGDFPRSVRQVSAFLAASGFPGYELVKGEGYYYFVGPDTSRWETASVMVNFVYQLTFEQWLGELQNLKQHNQA